MPESEGPAPIRLARADEVHAIQEVELDAGNRFRSIGMDAVADHPPTPVDVLAHAAAEGRLWVAADGDDPLSGFILAEVVDGEGHIAEFAVAQARGGRGIGRALVDTAVAWAQGRRLPAITLTTFLDVPWNASWYLRLGFEIIPTMALPPGLVRIREQERQRGLDRWPRVAMRRRLG
jgi:ribosomal protein S18 acetylase RimI-like enzyme